MPSSTTEKRIAVVLGGGSTLGRSFHAGVLLALERRLGLDPRSVDTIVGTSSGAIVASLVGAGLSAQDLYRHELGDELSPAGVALLAEADAWGSDRRSLLADAAMVGPAEPTGDGSVGGSLVRLMPRGRRRHDNLCSYVDGLHGRRWPERPDLKFCTVDVPTRRRVVLDRAAVGSPGPAVAASCALPGIHTPVRLGDRVLVDGAVHSMDNADVVEPDDREHDLVIVSSPLSAQRVVAPWQPLAAVRNVVRTRTRSEVRRSVSACSVVVVQPDSADIAAMGVDLGTNRRRARVARQALTTAERTFHEFTAHTPEIW